MTEATCRLAFIFVACCTLAACSSGGGQNDAGSNTEDSPPARGQPYVDANAGDRGDSAKPTDGASEAVDGTGDLSAETGDAASGDHPDAPADLADAPADLPMEKPPTNLGNGAACQAPSWCRSKFCVDGVCCDNGCSADDPMRCTACTMAKTGQQNGTCAADRSRDRMKCGEACGQLAMNMPAVFAMVCQQGNCVVPAVPTVVGEPCAKPGDMCTVSFCDQPTDRTARCVQTLCPQSGNCCCQMGDNTATRACVSTSSCKTDRACVTK